MLHGMGDEGGIPAAGHGREATGGIRSPEFVQRMLDGKKFLDVRIVM